MSDSADYLGYTGKLDQSENTALLLSSRLIFDSSNAQSFSSNNNVGGSAGGVLNTPGAGSTPTSPIPPSAVKGGAYTFKAPASGAWYQTPPSKGLIFSLSSGAFTEVEAPPASFGFGPVEVFVHGKLVATLDPGGTYLFGPDVTTFTLEDILLLAGGSSSSGMPTWLVFSGSPTDLTITPITGVPEPATWAMLMLGLGAIGAVLRRRGVGGLSSAKA